MEAVILEEFLISIYSLFVLFCLPPLSLAHVTVLLGYQVLKQFFAGNIEWFSRICLCTCDEKFAGLNPVLGRIATLVLSVQVYMS